MSTATKKKSPQRNALRKLSRQVSGLQARVEDLEDLRDLNAAVARNGAKPGTEWGKAKAELGLGWSPS